MGKKVVVFGSYVADLTGTGEHLPRPAETVFGETFRIGPGGKGSNQAVAAHRAGADLRLITKVGKDVFGDLALAFYEKERMDTQFVLVDEEAATGVALICVDEKTKQNQILVVPSACTRFGDRDLRQIEDIIRNADILLLQFEINMDALEKAVDIAKEHEVLIVLNPALAREVSRELLSKIDIITPNEMEAKALTGVEVTNEESALQAAQVFHRMGIPSVVITMGEKGAFYSGGSGQGMIPARLVKAVDTTGAGDAFNGGLVTALSEGKELEEAVRFGNTTASLSVQKFGTAPSMPYRREIDREEAAADLR